MAMMSTTNPATVADRFQTLLNKKMLKQAEQILVLDQFATKTPFPKNAGAKTMRMFRKLAGSAANVLTLSEGVPPTTYREVETEYVEATLVQYGEVIKMSDVLSMTDLFNNLLMSRESLAEDAALHADQIVRNVLVAGITGSANKIYAGGATTFNGLVAKTDAEGVMTIQDLLRAMTILQKARAPKKNGEYFAVVPPEVAYDLMLDTKFFIPVNTYQDKSNVVKGEVGKWFNVRVVVATVPFREANTNGTEGTFSGSGPIFTSFIVGSDAYATPIMAGESPYSPHIYIAKGSQKSDVLDQYTMAGFKTFWAAVVLNATWAVALRSKTSFA